MRYIRLASSSVLLNPQQIQLLLEKVGAGELSPADGTQQLQTSLRQQPFEDIGFARIDHQRELRQGFPEVIYCAGKTPDQVAQIAARIHQQGSTLLATRADEAAYECVRELLPEAIYDSVARVITHPNPNPPAPLGAVGVLCAGTSDLPVAQEAAITLETLGASVVRANDVGVAGLHRLLGTLGDFAECRVLIVVAGMEGALPSVVGGLVAQPVIAVPTSVGYGANFGGLAALLGMLNSCASGITVTNIDNGFGAAMAAAKILKSIQTH